MQLQGGLPAMNRKQETLMRQCRALHELTGCPGQAALENAVRYGSIVDCPVTATDISYWYRTILPIEGCNICAFAKLTKPANNIRVVKMIRSLLVDTYFARGVNGNIPILMAIDSATRFNNPRMLDNNLSNDIYKSLISILNQARVKDVSYDNIVVDLDKPSGKATKLLQDSILFENIIPESPPTGTHVSEVENHNKHVRQRIRAKYAEFKRNTFGISMPIQFEPGVTMNCIAMIQHVVSTATSHAISPAVLFDEERLSYNTLRMVRAGDIIIGYKNMGDVNGQYAVVLDHTLTFPPVVTRAYNLESNNECTGELVFARFVKADYKNIDISIVEKLRSMSREGRSKFKESNARAKRHIEHIKESMKIHPSNSDPYKNLEIRLKSVIQPCPDIDDDDSDHDDHDTDDHSNIGDDNNETVRTEPRIPPSIETRNPTNISDQYKSQHISQQQPLSKSSSYTPRIPSDWERNTSRMSTSEINAFIDKCIGKEHPKINPHYEIQEDIASIERYKACIFNMTVQQAIRQHPTESDLIKESFRNEYKQLLTTDDPNKSTVLKLVGKFFNKIGKPVLPSLDFSKRKINKATLNLDKWKHRVVAGGHKQDPNLYDKSDTSSPTLDHNTLLMFLSVLMREESMEFATTDFPGAYLATDIDEEIYMNISASKVAILLQDEEFQFLKPFVRSDGTVLTQIQRGIYGLKQAGKLWHDKLVVLLKEFGLEQLEGFPCIFKLKTKEGIMFVAVYVDDMMIACNNKLMREKLMNFLKRDFPDIELNTDLKQSFLGSAIEFNYTNKTIKYDNLQYIQELCEKYSITEGSQYPYDRHFLNNPPNDTIFQDTTEYRSLVMSIFYVAKRSRIELLFPISYLATFSSVPFQSHYDKAIVILKYLYHTQHFKITHKCNDDSFLHAYIDASYAIHHDAKSHTGSLIFDNTNILDGSSTKHQHMDKSSTGAEVSGVHLKMDTLESLRELYYELTEKLAPITVHQDNQSGMKLMTKGNSISNKSKHMRVRYFYVKEKIDDSIINLDYTPTNLMIADLLTKPLFGKQFRTFVQQIYNNEDIFESVIYFIN